MQIVIWYLYHLLTTNTNCGRIERDLYPRFTILALPSGLTAEIYVLVFSVFHRVLLGATAAPLRSHGTEASATQEGEQLARESCSSADFGGLGALEDTSLWMNWWTQYVRLWLVTTASVPGEKPVAIACERDTRKPNRPQLTSLVWRQKTEFASAQSLIRGV